jgi:hypothetical protein
MENNLYKYTVKVSYGDYEETITIKTTNIKWSMDQYSRNRQVLSWGIERSEEYPPPFL